MCFRRGDSVVAADGFHTVVSSLHVARSELHQIEVLPLSVYLVVLHGLVEFCLEDGARFGGVDSLDYGILG